MQLSATLKAQELTSWTPQASHQRGKHMLQLQQLARAHSHLAKGKAAAGTSALIPKVTSTRKMLFPKWYPKWYEAFPNYNEFSKSASQPSFCWIEMMEEKKKKNSHPFFVSFSITLFNNTANQKTKSSIKKNNNNKIGWNKIVWGGQQLPEGVQLCNLGSACRHVFCKVSETKAYNKRPVICKVS